MKKVTLELERISEWRRGYGSLTACHFDNETNVLNKLVEWAQKNPNIVIYRHIKRVEDEPQPGTFKSKYGPFRGPYIEEEHPNNDRVWYLDIYYQEK